MLIIYFSDNTNLKINKNDINSYSELITKIIDNKFKSNYIKETDLTIITKGLIIDINSAFNVDENQTFLVKINIDLEYIKYINDERLKKLINNENTRKFMYEILENPAILEKLKIYKYQTALDEIYKMGFKFPEDKIKNLLDKNNGNIELVLGILLN